MPRAHANRLWLCIDRLDMHGVLRCMAEGLFFYGAMQSARIGTRSKACFDHKKDLLSSISQAEKFYMDIQNHYHFPHTISTKKMFKKVLLCDLQTLSLLCQAINMYPTIHFSAGDIFERIKKQPHYLFKQKLCTGHALHFQYVLLQSPGS